MDENVTELSANMATESSRLLDVGAGTALIQSDKPETEFTVSGNGLSPEVDAVDLVVKPETETSDGDQRSSGQRRRRRRRKYGRLKRIQLEALALPVEDATTESESEKRFVVVDGPEVGIFRSSTTAAADSNGRPWCGRKSTNRNRKSAPRRKPGTSVLGAMTTKQRCERYLKQFVAALFSTLGLLCLMVAYTVLGGYVFCRLESSNEVNVKADMRQVTVPFVLH